MGRKKTRKKEPIFDDYEYGYGYDYLLDEEQKMPLTPLTVPMGRRMKELGGKRSRKKRSWLVFGILTAKILNRITAAKCRMMNP